MRWSWVHAILTCAVIVVSGPASAQEKLRIVAPSSDTLVTPGQRVQIVMRQAPEMEPGYFNSTITLAPSPIYVTKRLRAIDPYVMEIVVNASVRPGRYAIVGVGRRVGETAYTLSQPIYLQIPGSPAVGIRFTQENLYLEFPGEMESGRLYVQDKDGGSALMSDDMLRRVVWSVDHRDVVSVESDGSIVGLAQGSALVKAEVDGMVAFVSVAVRRSDVRGDLNRDNVVDRIDLDLLKAALNTRAVSKADARDLNGDGKIDALDVRILTTLCTRPRCATQ